MSDRCMRLRGYAQDEVGRDLLWMKERKADLHLKMMKSACLQHNFSVASKIVTRLDAVSRKYIICNGKELYS